MQRQAEEGGEGEQQGQAAVPIGWRHVCCVVVAAVVLLLLRAANVHKSNSVACDCFYQPNRQLVTSVCQAVHGQSCSCSTQTEKESIGVGEFLINE